MIMMDLISIIDELKLSTNVNNEKMKYLLEHNEQDEYLYSCADEVRKKHYGTDVYTRGLIEFTNYCKNNCYYCGIRQGNSNVNRYRLSKEQILNCCDEGYSLGFRTFVLQGGEDPFYSDELLCDIISEIRKKFKDCAITLSIGEKTMEGYKKYYNAGADRYLLRHETADISHYQKLHPDTMNGVYRKNCLFNLKKIGYQVGSGFMVGSPFQTTENLISDLRFLQTLMPDMIGIGPFITHNETPFADYKSGTVDMTLKLVAILRLMFPYALIPATTALGTIDPNGREKGLKAGANVVMPNLSPVGVRKNYELYENKICTGEEAAQCVNCLAKRVESVGYRLVNERGDVKK